MNNNNQQQELVEPKTTIFNDRETIKKRWPWMLAFGLIFITMILIPIGVKKFPFHDKSTDMLYWYIGVKCFALLFLIFGFVHTTFFKIARSFYYRLMVIVALYQVVPFILRFFGYLPNFNNINIWLSLYFVVSLIIFIVPYATLTFISNKMSKTDQKFKSIERSLREEYIIGQKPKDEEGLY
ncbi:hypothetical protein [Mycoplasmopsis fermentans]|uniref:hypothetical protein n=1 Tax=Mycoplasmopsis fermentans TaxID=2115 RepID=UPI000F013C5D|nr:hypothetical protein [Mycoplasmopsis fermentans]RMX34619.1 hypothetical protein MFI1_0825 [Mycoplasmopsis fermentans MF-I1]